MSFQNSCPSNICVIKDIEEEKETLLFEKTLRTNLYFCVLIFEELELVFLIVTTGTLKNLNLESTYNIGYISEEMGITRYLEVTI